MWKREPMMWLVVGIPAVAVVVGIAFLVTAVRTWDGLVVDDYYKKGKEINRQIDRSIRASDLKLIATIEHNTESGIIRATLGSTDDGVVENLDAITLRYVHRTRAGLDQRWQLRKTISGAFETVGTPPDSGVWAVQLETPEWRLSARRQLPASQLVVRAQRPL